MMLEVQRFLENTDNQKHTIAQFEAMVCPCHAVEKKSIDEFANIRGITAVTRMPPGEFGDIKR